MFVRWREFCVVMCYIFAAIYAHKCVRLFGVGEMVADHSGSVTRITVDIHL